MANNSTDTVFSLSSALSFDMLTL